MAWRISLRVCTWRRSSAHTRTRSKLSVRLVVRIPLDIHKGHDEIGGEGGQEGGRHVVEPSRQAAHKTLEAGVKEAEGAAVVRTYSVTK